MLLRVDVVFELGIFIVVLLFAVRGDDLRAICRMEDLGFVGWGWVVVFHKPPTAKGLEQCRPEHRELHGVEY